MPLTTNWAGCYREGWGKRLRPASFAHPAKNSYGLSVRIYEHALAEGWVEPGDYVVDCFSGVGGFALEALRHGLHFVGCELEQRFVDMGQGCDCTGISKEDWAHHQGRWDRMRYEGGRHWCPECLMKAGVVKGEWKSAVADKRKIKPLPLPGTKWAVLGEARQVTLFAAAPSTSYVRNSGKIPSTGAHHYRGNIETWEQDGMPGTAIIVQGDSRRLGEVLARASLCLSSPPYANSIHGSDAQDYDNTKLAGAQAGGLTAQRATWGVSRGTGTLSAQGYGETEGNLGNLPDTGFEAALAVSSPAWHKVVLHDGGPVQQQGGELHSDYGSESGQLAQMPEGDLALALGSPPYIGTPVSAQGADGKSQEWNKAYREYQRTGDHAKFQAQMTKKCDKAGYGHTDGQLAALPEGDHAEACERPVCCISSPPWESSLESKDTEFQASARPGRTIQCAAYGTEEGQLGQMPTGSHAEACLPEPDCEPACALADRRTRSGRHRQALEAGAVTPACADRGRAQACISSPPWSKTLGTVDGNDEFWQERERRWGSRVASPRRKEIDASTYGDTFGQLGQETGSTFWAASRAILEEVYQVLAPGGHAIWVVKMFVRNKKLVDFPGQWEALCQSVGFRTVCKHRAWLNKNADIMQTTLDGDEVSMEKWYKSFFRRLAESKGSPRIDWELVLCMEKPIN